MRAIGTEGLEFLLKVLGSSILLAGVVAASVVLHQDHSSTPNQGVLKGTDLR